MNAYAVSPAASMQWRPPPSRCLSAFNAAAARSARLLRPPRGLLAAAAAAGGASGAGEQEQLIWRIPGSRQEAVDVSVAALVSQIKPLLGSKKKSRKGFGGSSSGSAGSGVSRFSIELPLPGESAAELAALASDVLRRLPPAAAAGAAVVFGSDADAAAAAPALPRGACVLSLQSACRSDSLAGPLLLVAPGVADVALVEQLLDEVWCGPWALALNPSWQGGVPQAYSGLVGSFEAVYSFTPIATQGLMRVEGAVLRQLEPNAGPSGSPWRVLLQNNSGEFVQVGQMARRPSPSDLELVFINARAAQSPLTSFVKGVKGLLDRNKKQ